MSNLFCVYDHSTPKEEIADHKCDICDKLLCHICGYCDEEVDYCNECWKDKTEPKTEEIFKEIEKEAIVIFEHNGWEYAELFLKSKGFNFQQVVEFHEKINRMKIK